MNYTEAVRLAKDGDEAGFNFLYEETYKSKYYLALKYVQNEEAAKDVLQDAYMQALTKLDTLEDPEKFSAWFGIIVANTAKNALKKQNPMLFSDIALDSQEEEFEYQIEDESVQNQPEIAYSQKETQELVRELIDSLSEEQRMCILMFHIEGQSISEIAEALGCSENTVKSRLNYGRKNIKLKAEELQKKGYKLYSFAPVPFLLYLLKSEGQSLAAQGAFDAVGFAMKDRIMDSVAQTGMLKAAGANMSSGAAKQGFIHTLAGKIAVAGVGICIVAAGITGVVVNSHKNDENTVNDTVAEAQADTRPEADAQPETDIQPGENIQPEAEEEIAEQEITDEQYPSLLAGNLTKEQFLFILSYGPEYVTDSSPSIGDLCELMFRVNMSQINRSDNYDQIGLVGQNDDGDAWVDYNLSEVNNFLAVLADAPFTEQDNDKYDKVKVSGDALSILIVEPSKTKTAKIQKATLRGEELTVEYQVETWRVNDDTGEEQQEMAYKTAFLRKMENGTYRIVSITDRDPNTEGNTSETQTENDGAELFGTLPDTFWFSSGAGGWSTELHIEADGSFYGLYHDSDMGDTGEGYPNGTQYICNFTGKFTTPQKVNEYTYAATLESLEQERPSGEEYYEDGVRYIASSPYGLDDPGQFMIYLPGTPIADLPEEFISWAFLGEPEGETLEFYGIYNVGGEEGFTGSLD